MQSIKPTQIGIQANIVPVMPTEESQADKGIDHPIVSCDYCDTEWRSHTPSRCPGCARKVGTHLVLDEEQVSDLLDAIVELDESVNINDEDEWEETKWGFYNLLALHASWCDLDSLQVIQACYVALCERALHAPHPKLTLAISLFANRYYTAPEDENTFCPEDPEEVYRFTVDELYEKQSPSW